MNTHITIENPIKRKYLFVLCPPYNGSTVLYKILNSSPSISTFLGKPYKKLINEDGSHSYLMVPKGEGQILLAEADPTYFENRHKEGYKINVEKMKEIYDKFWDHSKDILCDKSPTYVHYAKEIEEYFEQFGEVYFIAMIRSPYSCNWTSEYTWEKFAIEQKYNIENLKNVLYFRYEELVTYPEKVKDKIVTFLPELVNIDMKTHDIQGLHKNAKRNQELTTEYRDRVMGQAEKNEYLKNIPEELDFFGYPFVYFE